MEEETEKLVADLILGCNFNRWSEDLLARALVSQAISQKRIADALEQTNAHLSAEIDLTKPEGK